MYASHRLIRAFEPLFLSRSERHATLDEWLSPITLDERASSYTGAMPSQNGSRASDKGFLAMSLQAYLQLLDWTGRQLRRDGEAEFRVSLSRS